MRTLNWLKQDFLNRKWEYILIALLILFVAGFQYATFKDFKQLPSPIYGGDYYFQLGNINAIKDSHNPLAGSAIPDSPSVYLPLYSTLVATFSLLTTIPTWKAMLFFSIIIASVSIILFYVLGRHILEGYFAVILPFISFGMLQLNLKYSPFTQVILLPLCLIFIYRLFYQDFGLKNAVLAGIFLGLMGLSHSTIFIEMALTYACFALYFFFTERHYRLNSTSWRFAMVIGVCAITAILISLIYWSGPIMHGGTTEGYTAWNSRDLGTLPLQLGYLFGGFIRDDMLAFRGTYMPFITLASIFGIFSIIFLKERSKQVMFLTTLLCAYVIVKNSYFLTEPILKLNFSPEHMPNFATPLLAAFGLSVFLHLTLKKHKLIEWAAIAAIIGLIALQTVETFQSWDSVWIKSAKTDLPDHLQGVMKYLDLNSKPDDVILTTNELGFSLHALTGRKLVIGRRAHNGAFVDLDRNNLDAAKMLYGNSSSDRTELLQRYHVKYLYWDYYWAQSEYQITDKGEVQGFFDPISIVYKPAYELELNRSNISFVKQHTWLDPALRDDHYRQLDILFLSPYNYRSAYQPWDSDLQSRLEEVWSSSYGNQKIAVLYKVSP